MERIVLPAVSELKGRKGGSLRGALAVLAAGPLAAGLWLSWPEASTPPDRTWPLSAPVLEPASNKVREDSMPRLGMGRFGDARPSRSAVAAPPAPVQHLYAPSAPRRLETAARGTPQSLNHNTLSGPANPFRLITQFVAAGRGTAGAARAYSGAQAAVAARPSGAGAALAALSSGSLGRGAQSAVVAGRVRSPAVGRVGSVRQSPFGAGDSGAAAEEGTILGLSAVPVSQAPGGVLAPAANEPGKPQAAANPAVSNAGGAGDGSAAGESNGAAFLSQTAPSSVSAGQTYEATVTFLNTGSTAWTSADGFQLRAQNPADNIDWGMSAVTLDHGDSIGPGEQRTFAFPVTAPLIPGDYNFQWRMSQGTQAFGDLSPGVLVSVRAQP